MIALFQPPKSNKSVDKAVGLDDRIAHINWIPINKSFLTLIKIILRSAIESLAVENIVVTLRSINHQGYRHLILADNQDESRVTALGAELEEFIISTETSIDLNAAANPVTESVTLPIDYAQRRLGYLVANFQSVAGHCDERDYTNTDIRERKINADLSQVVGDIVAVVRRYEIRYRAIFVYGDHYYWIGNSKVLRELEQNMDQLAVTSQPVLICGNLGTGKYIAARTLHCMRNTDVTPFIVSSCQEWHENAANSVLQSLYASAKGGTLFLRNIDKLSAANFNALTQFYVSKSSDLTNRNTQNLVDLIFSTSQQDFQVTASVSTWLTNTCVALQLPSLSERRDDIRDLVRFFMSQFAPQEEFYLDEQAWQLLEDFAWQENVDQLKRVVQGAVLLAEDQFITAAILTRLLD